MGIIDILQPYSATKMYESIGKTALGYVSSQISVVPPPQYSVRFLDMVTKITRNPQKDF